MSQQAHWFHWEMVICTWISQINYQSFMMTKNQLATARYTYMHDDCQGLHGKLDTHHILIQRSNVQAILVYLFVSILLTGVFFACSGKFCTAFLWSILFSACTVGLFYLMSVVKESVVIMPAFGVQLETHLWRCAIQSVVKIWEKENSSLTGLEQICGKVVQSFIPMDKILKPVLNEHVTPFTCYWSLALVLQGAEELMLVFKEVQLSMNVLVPIWKAMCVAKDGGDTASEDVQ